MRTVLALALLLGACGHAPAPIEEMPDAATAPSPDAPPAPDAMCTGSAAGAYCGGDEVDLGDPSTLYTCPGPGQAPTMAVPCAAGCLVEPAGTPDRCATPVASDGYRLPWRPGVAMQLTQDCNDSCCSDHVGIDEYAYDWANGASFAIVAPRGGTITHLKSNSTTGCGTASCVDDANYVVIDHGDGTQSTFLHLEGGSLEPGIACGATVVRGQALARSGTTGWSTGIHLHFQVSMVHPGAATCECGMHGNACDPSTVNWSPFWVTQAFPSQPIQFAEWPEAAQCGDRRLTMPASQNQ